MNTNSGDFLIIKDLVVYANCGDDLWQRRKPQPVRICLWLETSLSVPCSTDTLDASTSYSDVAKTVECFARETPHETPEALAASIAKVCLGTFPAILRIRLTLEATKALLNASLVFELTRTKEDFEPGRDKEQTELPAEKMKISVTADMLIISNLSAQAIIGVNRLERELKQAVLINLAISCEEAPFKPNATSECFNFRQIAEKVTEFVEMSHFKTVEALANAICRLCIVDYGLARVTVSVEKPCALLFAGAAGVQISRSRASFEAADFPGNSAFSSKPTAAANAESETSEKTEVPQLTENLSIVSQLKIRNKSSKNIAFIGVGTNLGNRVANIRTALAKVSEHSNITIVDTSFLYETSPMHVLDQPMFLNAAFKVLTYLDAEALLHELKSIEHNMKRDPNAKRYGPRVIDLDILFYNDSTITLDKLTIPHPRLAEREFVLRPLCDIAKDFVHPALYLTCAELLNSLRQANLPDSDAVKKVLPVRNRIWTPSERTYLMGILNVTPDSFSGDGIGSSVPQAVLRAAEMARDGADIIDIGGMSSRPGADEVPESEELARVIKVIEAIRSIDIDTPISIDTFRSEVARQAIAAGADFINDISAGSRDPKMLSVAAAAGVPICLMHMRGDAKTMTSLTQYDRLVDEIYGHLHARANEAIAKQVLRWNIVLDPGIGFAKDASQNREILRSGISSERDYPLLLGPSRKGFIGRLTNETEPGNRGWGTAAAVAACVAGKASIVRVHDVKEMRQVIQVADAIWKSERA